MRDIVVAVYFISFVLILGCIAVIPSDYWRMIQTTIPWQGGIFAWDVIIACCGVCIAYWVYRDDEELKVVNWHIRELNETNQSLEKRIKQLEDQRVN
jgi:hypothetical protein